MSSKKITKVKFNKSQLELLINSFPQLIINPNSKIEDIMFDAGKQSVIKFISEQTDTDEVFYG